MGASSNTPAALTRYFCAAPNALTLTRLQQRQKGAARGPMPPLRRPRHDANGMAFEVGHVQGQKRQKKGTIVMIEDGMNAPDFELPDAGTKHVRLSQLRGRPVVIYFYPKDDTSGCTAEAKSFSCHAEAFKEAGAQVIGISPDSPTSHHKFAAKYDLNIRLLADEEKAAAQAYGVWVEKNMYGRKYMGVERSTFLLDAAGKIVRSWRKVKVTGHAEEVLAAVQGLTS